MNRIIKKIPLLSIGLMAFVCTMSACSGKASASSSTPSDTIVIPIEHEYSKATIDGIEYKLDHSTHTAEVLCAQDINIAVLKIKEKIKYNSEFYIVTSIGNSAFMLSRKLTTVILPNSILEIGVSAFCMCEKLKSVVLPNSVKKVGGDAFAFCDNLNEIVHNNRIFAHLPQSYKGAYSVPNGIEIIADGAFCGCEQLTSATIPNSVKHIDGLAFMSCNNLSTPVYNDQLFAYLPSCWQGEFSIPDGIESIASTAFFHADKITKIIFPKSIKGIDANDYYINNAFLNCSLLRSFDVHPENQHFSSIDGMLYNKKGTKLIKVPNAKYGKVVILENVTVIDTFAFANTTHLNYIEVESGNQCYSSSLDGVLFNKNKSSLVACPGGKQNSYIIPDGVKVIESGAFAYSNLSTIVIPNSVTSIKRHAFRNCDKLSTLKIPQSVVSIEEEAFWGNNDLTLILPESLRGKVDVWAEDKVIYY